MLKKKKNVNTSFLIFEFLLDFRQYEKLYSVASNINEMSKLRQQNKNKKYINWTKKCKYNGNHNYNGTPILFYLIPKLQNKINKLCFLQTYITIIVNVKYNFLNKCSS